MSLPVKFSKKCINGHTEEGSFKASFGRAGKKFLNEVGAILSLNGYVADGKGPYFNAGGNAVSGEITGIWFHPERKAGIYAQISASCVKMPNGADNGLCIMFRANSRTRKYDGFTNCYVKWNVEKEEFAGLLLREAERNEATAERS